MSSLYPSWLQRVEPGSCWAPPQRHVFSCSHADYYYHNVPYPDDCNPYGSNDYANKFSIPEQQPPDPPPPYVPPSWSPGVRGYILGEDQLPLGPYSISTLHELHSRGYLHDNTLFWAEGWRNWHPISSVLGFSSRYNHSSFSDLHSVQPTQQPQYSVPPPQQPSVAGYNYPHQPPSAACYVYTQQQVQTHSVLSQQTAVPTSQPQAVLVAAPTDAPSLPAQSLLRAPPAPAVDESLAHAEDVALVAEAEMKPDVAIVPTFDAKWVTSDVTASEPQRGATGIADMIEEVIDVNDSESAEKSDDVVKATDNFRTHDSDFEMAEQLKQGHNLETDGTTAKVGSIAGIPHVGATVGVEAALCARGVAVLFSRFHEGSGKMGIVDQSRFADIRYVIKVVGFEFHNACSLFSHDFWCVFDPGGDPLCYPHLEDKVVFNGGGDDTSIS